MRPQKYLAKTKFFGFGLKIRGFYREFALFTGKN